MVDIETEDNEVPETKQEVENPVKEFNDKNTSQRGPNGGTLCIPSVRRLAKEYKVVVFEFCIGFNYTWL